MKPTWRICIPLCLSLLSTPAIADEPSEAASWFRGVNSWGAQGIMATDSALGSVPGDLVMAVGQSAFTVHELFLPNDSDTAFTTTLNLAFTPIDDLQVGLSGSFLNSTYIQFANYTLRSLGNPQAHIKYGHAVAPGWAVGVSAHALVSTFQQGDGLSQLGMLARIQAVASYHLNTYLEAHVNLGYVLDRSAAPFQGAALGVQERFALGINNTSHIHYTAGVVGHYRPWALQPFVELVGEVGGATSTSPATLYFSPGVRVDTSYGGPIEGLVGANIRALGAPTLTGNYAGLPPWEVFLQLALHVRTGAAAEDSAWNARDCTQDSDCPAGMVCQQPRCVAQRAADVPPPPAIKFALHGTITDAHDGTPIRRATVTLAGFEQAPLHVNETGQYVTFPLEATGKLVGITAVAPGYDPVQRNVLLQPSEAETSIDFALAASTHVSSGKVHGVVHNGKTRAPLAGAVIFVPALGKKFDTDSTGQFVGELPAGEYDVLITAKHFVETRLHIEVTVGGTAQMNVNLQPQAKAHR